ncbi:hypothetical protein R4Z09_08220 [Niallia oryzisoli]|uniref:Holin n=1 Tax=Niallia oryzisoli TaxID=1737571 RepID=A0ABZ2CHT0_9BACI
MYEFLNLVVIPLIIGMVEIIKKAGLPVRFAPIVAVAIGLFFGIFYLDTLKEGIIVGLMVGLSASGLYSGSKNIRNGNGYEKLNDKK